MAASSSSRSPKSKLSKRGPGDLLDPNCARCRTLAPHSVKDYSHPVTRSLTRLLALCVGAFLCVSAASAQSFTLRPGDVVRVTIPREPELSGVFDVDLAQAVTLPMIGRVELAGKPWSDVYPVILAAYRRELKEPGIVITPLRRVTVLGAVNKPGSYYLDPTATLSGAIASASGAESEARLHKIHIVRADVVINASASAERELTDIPLESGDQIFVLPPSWLARNGTALASIFLSVAGLVAALTIRR